MGFSLWGALGSFIHKVQSLTSSAYKADVIINWNSVHVCIQEMHHHWNLSFLHEFQYFIELTTLTNNFQFVLSKGFPYIINDLNCDC